MKQKTIREYIRENRHLQNENKRLKEENEKSVKTISDLRVSINGYIERAGNNFSRHKERIIDLDKATFDLNFGGLSELFPNLIDLTKQRFEKSNKGGVHLSPPPEVVYVDANLAPTGDGGYQLIDQSSGPFVVAVTVLPTNTEHSLMEKIDGKVEMGGDGIDPNSEQSKLTGFDYSRKNPTHAGMTLTEASEFTEFLNSKLKERQDTKELFKNIFEENKILKEKVATLEEELNGFKNNVDYDKVVLTNCSDITKNGTILPYSIIINKDGTLLMIVEEEKRSALIFMLQDNNWYKMAELEFPDDKRFSDFTHNFNFDTLSKMLVEQENNTIPIDNNGVIIVTFINKENETLKEKVTELEKELKELLDKQEELVEDAVSRNNLFHTGV